MRQATERHQPGKAEPNKQAWLNAEIQTETLLEFVQETQAEQTALLEATPLESQYGAGFTALVEEKHDQVERIEDVRLDVA